MDWIFLGIIILSGLFFSAGDILLKYWSMNNNYLYLFGIFIMYLLGGLFLAYSFKRKEFALSIVIQLCFSILFVAIMGIYLFKEALGFKEIVGISFSIIGIVLLSI